VIRTLTALLVIGALAVAGCGSKKSSSTGGQASTPATSTPAETTATTMTSVGASSAKTVTIDMRNISFSPKQVTVKVGQTVKWENYDSVDHNVVATQGETFKSNNFGKGASFKYTVDKAAAIKYVCTLHPGMEGTITVTQ
jgi:plastocyanin